MICQSWSSALTYLEKASFSTPDEMMSSSLRLVLSEQTLKTLQILVTDREGMGFSENPFDHYGIVLEGESALFVGRERRLLGPATVRSWGVLPDPQVGDTILLKSDFLRFTGLTP